MKLSTTLILVLFALSALSAQKKQAYKEQWQFPPLDSSMIVTAQQQREIAATEEEMRWFKDAKLGIFIHWGPALLETDVLSWGRDGERPAANKAANGGVPTEVYDSLYRQFNPVNFDADEWMRRVKDFGAHYLVFTAKHHDGFCFFDAPGTDYDIMNTPFGRDIAAELADAAHRHKIKLFWYYSQPDWTHPDCLREHHYERYLPYMKAQVEHLYTQYGRIDGVFWDHLASKYWQWDSYHLQKKMREWQPGMISNPRNGFSWPLNDERGDYDTPEQSLGPTDHPRYWEACLTMTDKWLYHKNGPIKPAATVLGMLIQVVANGGNLLLNFGPDGKGEFVSEEVIEGRKIGDWLKKYGHTLYGTRRGIYVGGDWGGSTQVGDTLYLHFLQKVAPENKATFELPALPVEILVASGVTAGFRGHRIEGGKLLLDFDSAAFGENLDNIAKLVLKKSPDGLERIETWHGEPLESQHFSVSATTFTSDKFAPDAIYQDRDNVFSEGIRLKSWWQPENDDEQAALTLDFRGGKKISTVLLSENMRSHSVRKFSILTKDVTGNWQTAYHGDVIGEGLRVKLNGEPIHGLRLRVEESEYKTQITAFQPFE